MNRLKSKILPIWAVAAVVLRRLWRTGIGPVSAILTVTGILLLRQAIQGDGTLTGMVRIWLSYSIALVSFLISATTLLIGASAISLENAAGRLQLVRVKPISFCKSGWQLAGISAAQRRPAERSRDYLQASVYGALPAIPTARQLS